MIVLDFLRRPIPAWGLLIPLMLVPIVYQIMGPALFQVLDISSLAQAPRTTSDVGDDDAILSALWLSLAALGLFGAGLCAWQLLPAPLAARSALMLPEVPVQRAPLSGAAQADPSDPSDPSGVEHADALMRAGRTLETELSKVLAVVRAGIGSTETFAESLAEAQRRLAALPTSEQVRVVVKLLLAENQRMRIDSQSMKTELESARSKIERLNSSLAQAHEDGMRDPLTGVGNRRCFDQTLQEAIQRTIAGKSRLCVVMADIDYFKKINDEFGHQIGDEVLKIFAQILVTSVRGGDTVTRFGGEEFAVVLPGTASEDAAQLADRIRQKFEARSLKIRKTNQLVGKLTASFGIAEYMPGEGMVTLIQRVDAKLYEAKRNGRNRVAA